MKRLTVVACNSFLMLLLYKSVCACLCVYLLSTAHAVLICYGVFFCCRICPFYFVLHKSILHVKFIMDIRQSKFFFVGGGLYYANCTLSFTLPCPFQFVAFSAFVNIFAVKFVILFTIWHFNDL